MSHNNEWADSIRHAREVLQKNLTERSTKKDLIQRNILKDYSSAPILQATQGALQRKKLENSLERTLNTRRSANELRESGIMKPLTLAPVIAERRHALEKHNLQQRLEHQLEDRPGVLDLVQRNIVQPQGHIPPYLCIDTSSSPSSANNMSPDMSVPTPPPLPPPPTTTTRSNTVGIDTPNAFSHTLSPSQTPSSSLANKKFTATQHQQHQQQQHTHFNNSSSNNNQSPCDHARGEQAHQAPLLAHAAKPQQHQCGVTVQTSPRSATHVAFAGKSMVHIAQSADTSLASRTRL
eukprot:m.75188 g.75188  ORF g.75188 m.75188 type:complete len:293 (-) comp11838_c1_seq2:203-1081(-)